MWRSAGTLLRFESMKHTNTTSGSSSKKANDLPMELAQIIRNGSVFSEKALEITGPPRTRKSTWATKTALAIALSENKNIVMASRTKKNARANYSTFREYIVPEDVAGIRAVQYFGMTELCPNADGERPWVEHMQNCGKKKENLPAHDYTENDWTEKLWETVYNDGFCPYKMRDSVTYKHINGDEPCIVFTTYSSLSGLTEEINIGETIFILDEYRHTPQMAVEEAQNHELKKAESWREILGDWRAEYHNIDYSSLPISCSDQVEELVNRFFVHLEKILVLSRARDHWKDSYKECAWENRDSFCCEVSKDLMTELASKTDHEEVAKLYDLVQLIEKLGEENREAIFDLIEGKDETPNSLSLAIRKMDGNSESRETIQDIIGSSRKAMLVDSTPFPAALDRFVFGEEPDYDTVVTEPWFNFRLVVEDAKYTLTDIRESSAKREKHIKKVKGIQEQIAVRGYTSCVFARSKDEKKMLEDAGIKNVTYFRGSDAEGTQLDYDYVISTGLPLQNMMSESYRKREIEGSSITHRNYIRLKAFMEMLQGAFRPAGKGESGVIFLNMKGWWRNDIQEYWAWSKQFEWKKPPVKDQSIDRRILELSSSILDEELPSLARKEIRKMFQIKPYWSKTELTKSTDIRNKEVIEARKKMEQEGIIRDEGLLELNPDHYIIIDSSETV